jgi:hypothetical protein
MSVITVFLRYPLRIEADKVDIVESEFSVEVYHSVYYFPRLTNFNEYVRP